MKFDSGNAAGLIAYSALFDHGLAPCVRTSDGRCCSYRVNPSRGNNFVSRYSGHSGRRVRMFVSPACDSRPLRFAVSRRLIICAACFPSHDNPMDGVFVDIVAVWNHILRYFAVRNATFDELYFIILPAKN